MRTAKPKVHRPVAYRWGVTQTPPQLREKSRARHLERVKQNLLARLTDDEREALGLV